MVGDQISSADAGHQMACPNQQNAAVSSDMESLMRDDHNEAKYLVDCLQNTQ